MPKVTAATIAVTALLLFALTGCSGAVDGASDESTDRVVTEESTAETPASSGTADPLVAEEPGAQDAQTAYLDFVRGRLSTFPTQIPNATDDQLLAAAKDACDRIRAGESVEGMSVIQDEQPSEIGGYFFDSNAIIAGAQMHLCTDTLS